MPNTSDVAAARAVVLKARATANRGSVHIFLGHPLSAGCDKTTVEPGNITSPGVWTCGISVWFVLADGTVASAELLTEDQITWWLDTSEGPVAESRYVLDGLEVIHRTCHLGGPGGEGCDFHRVTLRGGSGALPFVVVRDVGPAGGKVVSLATHNGEVLINGGTRLRLDRGTPSISIFPADARYDSPVGAVHVAPAIEGDTAVFEFRVEHAFVLHPFAREIPVVRPFAEVTAAQAFDRNGPAWDEALPAHVFAPDPRIATTWQRCAYHVLAAMECGLPRIGAVNYPHLWLRDGVIVLRALDLIGRHDLARLGNEHLAPILFSGGFGAEADAPGQAIWCLVRHAAMTRNDALLRGIFPLIQARVVWIQRMLAATEPIYAVGQNRIPFYTDTVGMDVLCLPAVAGTIHGRMDWHAPDFFINCWSWAGLALGADAAAWLGHTHLADAWRADAAVLDAAVASHLLPAYGNDRDPVIAPYPSGALPAHRDALRDRFLAWYRKNRLTEAAERKAEPLWTYFEAAQIHNAILLGLRELAWINLDGMLSDGGDVRAYVEGPPNGNEMLPFRNGQGRRGWLDPARAAAGNMPHNWTSAEMLTLLRDMMVAEADGEIVLGLGVRPEWLFPGARWGCKGLPTDKGPVSYTARVGLDGSINLDYQGPRPFRMAWPDPSDG